MDESIETSKFILSYLEETWNELTKHLSLYTQKLPEQQLNDWQSYFDLCQSFSTYYMKTSDESDKRFQHPDWQNNLIFNFIRQSYLQLTQQVDDISKKLCINDEKIVQKFRFYSRQLLDALAPTNFANLNPDVITSIASTKGVNLIEGLKQFKEDLEQSHGQFQIKLSDLKQFEIGKNIACTAGQIVYQNDLMQLILYTPTTKKTHENPLLIIPPWINKYYILDLQAENSMVKWLVDHGHIVFMISWVNPCEKHSTKDFSDYLSQGPIACLNYISKYFHKINILGYCIGGTLLACLLAYFTRRKSRVEILSATFLTTLLDFSEPGELGVFIDEKQISMIEQYMDKRGYLDGQLLASVFNALRANDLIWPNYVNRYLKGQQPKPFDLLYWNADSTNIPAKTHRFYLRNMYLNNLLIKPNKIDLDGTHLDLRRIKVPCYFLAAQDDHIVPWKSSYKSQRYLKQVKFVLAGSGHVAGIINPPHKRKYGYWTNKNKPKDADKFLSAAVFHKGSWWPDWQKWLKRYSGCMTNSDLSQLDDIEPAPGAYVKIKLQDKLKDKSDLD